MLKRYTPFLGTHYSYPVWNRIMEVLGIALYMIFAVLLVAELGQMMFRMAHEGLGKALMVAVASLPMMVLAMFLADFVSGFVHCAADNFGSPSTPVFGVAFIRPFRDHHKDPTDITRHDFVETNGNSCIVNLVVLVPTYYLAYADTSAPEFLLGAFVLMFTLMIVLTNQIHKWAHMAVPPSAIRPLQRFGLILSPGNHQVHHTEPFDRNYCITTGWMNAIIERTGAFAWMVRTFRRG